MDKAEYALIMDKAEFAAEIVIQLCAKSLTKNLKTGRRIERDMFLFMKYFICTVQRHVSSRGHRIHIKLELNALQLSYAQVHV